MNALEHNVIRVFYESRDLGYGVEAGDAVGIFTGEVDTWGKHTFVRFGEPPLYLFADEVIDYNVLDDADARKDG